MKNSILSLIFFFACYVSGTAQSKHEVLIDSLIKKANGFVSMPDSLAIYAEQAYTLSKKHNYQRGVAFSAKSMGISSFYKSNHDEAVEFHRESLKLQQTLGDSLEVAKAYYNIANSYNAKADIANTTENALAAIRMFDLLGDYNGQGRVYNLLGIASSRNSDQKKALEYFQKYHQCALRANDALEIATSANNLGSTFTELQQNDSALFYLFKAIEIYEGLDGHRNLSGSYDNIARLLEKEGKLDEAISNLDKAIALAVKEENTLREAGALYNLGRIYRKKNDNARAFNLINRSLGLARQIGDRYQQLNSLEQLAYIKSEMGQFREAYDYLFESTVHKDSIFNVELATSQEELKAIYETEKKEQAIQTLNQENIIQKLRLRQQSLYLLASIALIILLVAGSWLIIRQRKLRTEALLQKELAKKQEEATIAIVDAEERERTRIAADLHDGVGQLLSAALLNLNQVNKSLEAGEDPKGNSMENAISLVKDSYNEMREISHQMMPNALLKAGLSYSIREFLNKVGNEHLKINLDIVGMNERLSQQTEIVLYRCIQEAVNNMIKHAKADRLSIQLVQDEDGISVTIEDNGVGFDSKKTTGQEGIGLRNIRSRVELLQGTLDIDSVPGKGSLLVIFIPGTANN